MEKRHLGTLLLLLACAICHAYSPDPIRFTENTPDSVKFKTYLDSLAYNSYFNSPFVVKTMDKCEQLLLNGADIPEHLLYQYGLQQVTYEQNEDNFLKSYQILKEAKRYKDAPGISKLLRSDFKYVEGFTLMILGDYEFAQKVYYELLENGEIEKDTILISQSLFSLGQLFSMKEDYPAAERNYLRLYDIKMVDGKLQDYEIQILFEMVHLYIEMKDFEKAEKFNDLALSMADTTAIPGLKIDFLLFKVDIELDKSNITEAKKAYHTAFKLATESDSESILQLKHCKSQYASILEKEGKHKEALAIYQEFLDQEKIFHYKLFWSDKVHTVLSKMGDYKKAYELSLQSAAIKDSIQGEKKMQQTEFLAAKFDAEQKQKVNQTLRAEMLEKEMHHNHLYGILGIIGLGLLVLFGMFFQKLKYNKRLKTEVESRTKELQESNHLLSESNKEMDEFNRILSHDLKEPLRSIVGFSALAEKAIEPESTAGEYLGFIANSGRQLNQLIEDVTKFQKAGDFTNSPLEQVDTNQMIESIQNSIDMLIQKRNVRLIYANLPTVFSQKSFLFLVFKNLIENSIKYNESKQPIIQIRHREAHQTHFFEVADNGIGIAPKYHDKVFGMFQRLNVRSAYEGTGLGLSMARKIMNKLNGEIKILKSEEGKGSVFQVSFPVNVVEDQHYAMSAWEAN